MHCVDPTPKNTLRKRFTCTDCSGPTILSTSKKTSPHVSAAVSESVPVVALESVPVPTSVPVQVPTPVAESVAPAAAEDPTKPKASGKKYSGFAGFLKAEKTRLKRIKLMKKSNKSVLKKNTVRNLIDQHTALSKPPAIDLELKIEDVEKVEIKQQIQTDQKAIHLNTYDSIKLEMKPPRGFKTTISMPADLKKSEKGAWSPIVYDVASRFTPHENIPDCHRWDCDEVYTYFMGTSTPQIAQLFKDNEIDGDALLLMKREDILRFNLKLGVALRLYSQIVSLQFKNNNPILVWNED